MARPVSNPPLPSVRVKTTYLNYKKTLSLAQTVHAMMLANVGSFPTPFPTLVTFLADIAALQSAIGSLGTKTNKASKSQVIATQNASLIVHDDLVALASYVTNVIRSNNVPVFQKLLITLSGYAAKKKKAKVPTVQFVRNLQQVNNKKFPPAMAHVRWKKPLGLFTGKQLPSYDIFDMTTGSPVFLTTTTQTRYTVNPTGVRPFTITSVMIVPKNSSGNGNSQTIPLV